MCRYVSIEDVQKMIEDNKNTWVYWETAIDEIEKKINSLTSVEINEI